MSPYLSVIQPNFINCGEGSGSIKFGFVKLHETRILAYFQHKNIQKKTASKVLILVGIVIESSRGAGGQQVLLELGLEV